MKVEATNSVGGIKTYVDTDITSGDFSFCVHYGDLSRYINAVTDDYITMIVDMEDKVVKVQHSGGEISIPCIDANDFPEMENANNEECHQFAITGDTLSDWLQKAKGFVSSDQLRPFLMGAYIKAEGDTLSVAASDRTSLYCDSISSEPFEEPFDAIVPVTAFNAITSISDKADTVQVSTNGKKIWLKSESTTLMSVLLEGKYPNIKSVIPAGSQYEATVSKKSLVEALKRIGFAIGVQSHVIKFSFSDSGTLTLSHENIGDMKTASESTTYEGGINFTIGFGRDSIVKAISAIDSNDVVMQFNAPNKAAILKEPEGSEGKIVLVMPISLK